MNVNAKSKKLGIRLFLMCAAFVLLACVAAVIYVSTRPPATSLRAEDFCFAVWWDKYDEVDRALRLKPDLASAVCEQDWWRQRPIQLAIEQEHFDIVELLILKGKNTPAAKEVNGSLVVTGDDFLSVLDHNNHLEFALRLLHAAGGAFSTSDKEAALRRAAQNGNISVVRALLDGGIDVNAADRDGQTPLHYCTFLGPIKSFVGHDDWAERVTVARLLIQRGANLNAKDAVGRTPLDLLAGEKEKQWMLWSTGAIINYIFSMNAK